MGVFADDDGSGYLLSEDRDHVLHIYLLAADYLSIEEVVSTTLSADRNYPLGPHGYESPAMAKVDGRYYLFGSELTGWSSNDNQYATAPSPAGPWSDWRDFAPSGSATYDSQISTVVPINGASTTSYVYVGDRWDRNDLFHSAPVWLPLHIHDGIAQLEWRDEWTIDPRSGSFS
ncbi:family 43 glycosylhydrolase [Arthrobacter sp. JZ12]|uniref:family 43 glycosylhydrolase n=1 Tax=Arthrobacter sp. JZ12 TaxID=2654190 RepID=UPI002B49B3F1|nr:family 43 glycosylhydrolase [Arthrobacter sp. JZ12]